jgi:hypothetical protein
VPSNQTSDQPGDSASASHGASGLPTAKLSPISGNAAGAMAASPAPVRSVEQRHPYSSMSADDYNVEPTGELGITDQPALVDSETVMMPDTRKRSRDRAQRLFTSTISGPARKFPEDTTSATAQRLLDQLDPSRSGKSIPSVDATSYDCKEPMNLVKFPPRARSFRALCILDNWCLLIRGLQAWFVLCPLIGSTVRSLSS